MPTTSENFNHFFGAHQWERLPVVSSPLSVLALPLLKLREEELLRQFRGSFVDSSLFIKRIEVPFVDRLLFSAIMEDLSPAPLKAKRFGFARSELQDSESLGGVGTKLVGGLYILTVIGLLREGTPLGFVWIKTGDRLFTVPNQSLTQPV